MKKILIAGDVEGNFEFLFSKIKGFKDKGQEFDFCLCVGKCFSSDFDLDQFKKANQTIPIRVFFIDSSDFAPILHTLFPQGKVICPNFEFLGNSGIREIEGISIGYISGKKSSLSTEVIQELKNYNTGEYSSHDITKFLMESQPIIQKGIDILLTSEWPNGFETHLGDSFDKKIENKNGDISLLAQRFKPRYHFVGLENLFFKRNPYENEGSHVTRLIGLGKVPKDSNTSTKQQYLFALQIKGIKESTPEELLIRPEETTKNPYLLSSLDTYNSRTSTTKIRRAEDGVDIAQEKQEPEILEQNLALYFTGFDKRSSEMEIHEFLSRWGDIDDYQLLYDSETKKHRGNGFVLFRELKVTQKALNESGKYSLHGKKVYFSKASKGTIEGGKLSKQNAECWFCLDNPNVAKDLIVYVGEELYIALDKGPINDHHLLMTPIDHYPNEISLPLKAADELKSLKIKLVENYEKEFGEMVLFYERFMKVTQNIAHMIVNAVPYSMKDHQNIVSELQKRMNSSRFNVFEMRPNEKLEDLVYEREYYFYLEIINPKEKRVSEFYAKRYLIILKENEVRNFPKDFGRELCCDIMNCRNKIDWKNCVLSEKASTNLSGELRKLLNK